MAVETYGSAELHSGVDEAYETPDEYADQGDTRKVRDLVFMYKVAYEDPVLGTTLMPVDVPRDTEVTLEQIGAAAQQAGEANHSFYTTAELEQMARGDAPLALTEGDPSTLDEYELAEYIKGANPEGKTMTAQEVVDLAGNDADFAERLLQAENIASDGDPRKTVEAGLTSIIQG